MREHTESFIQEGGCLARTGRCEGVSVAPEGRVGSWAVTVGGAGSISFAAFAGSDPLSSSSGVSM